MESGDFGELRAKAPSHGAAGPDPAASIATLLQHFSGKLCRIPRKTSSPQAEGCILLNQSGRLALVPLVTLLIELSRGVVGHRTSGRIAVHAPLALSILRKVGGDSFCLSLARRHSYVLN